SARCSAGSGLSAGSGHGTQRRGSRLKAGCRQDCLPHMTRMDKIPITMTVNGEQHTVETWPMMRLLDVLREDLGLTGTKEGCGEGECGACSILLDGSLVNSCLVPALQADSARITTIEGIATPEQLHAMQQAFIECGGAQCGICTPGMIVAAVSLLEQNP